MIGTRYWSTGITVRYAYAGASRREGILVGQYGWMASLNFLDDGFNNDDRDSGQIATEGELRTRYFVRAHAEPASADEIQEGHRKALQVAIDVLCADAERMGIHFGTAASGPWLYYQGDGESAEWPPPDGWRLLLAEQATRLGWETYS